MKYEVFINGGFANIPKHYKGEIVLQDSKKKELLEILRKTPKPSQEIHDGFSYHIKMLDGVLEMKSVFDEYNLPQQVRDFIDSVKDKK